MKKINSIPVAWLILTCGIFFTGNISFAQNNSSPLVTNKLGSIQVVEDKIVNKHHPQVAYWFITPDLLEHDKYLSDLDSIAKAGIFDLVFLTAREGLSFFDTAKMHPVLTRLVHRAHQKGIRIGLQLWQDNKPNSEREDVDALVSEKEITLDEEGKGKAVLSTYNVRGGGPTHSELLKAIAFKKTGEGFYQEGSMMGITSLCKSIPGVDSVEVTIEGGRRLAGYQVFLSGVHYVRNGNLFGDYFIRSYRDVLDRYADIPFDATGLDEFKAMTIKRPFELKDGIFHEKKYSIPFATVYKAKYGRELESEFFRMRYAPEGKQEDRIKCINQYMDEIRSASNRVETYFYEKSKSVFGTKTFSGLHNTFHRSVDEYWQTGKNYWNIPREYGHTDELETKPVQLGVLYSHKMNMMYNMFYDKDTSFFLRKATEDLAYNIRTHYHAINDHAHGWGVSIETPVFQQRLAPVEQKARLLNQFNPAAPETDLLIVFGFEAVLNWYPEIKNRDSYDLNDRATQPFEKADSVWKRGYINALVPADQIENGKLKLNEKNELIYNGHVFKALIFLYPQFSKESTISLLEKFVKKGGKLMLVGPAKYDFNGKEISALFDAIRKKATVDGFDISRIPELGIQSRSLTSPILMEDGSLVKSDYNSIASQTSTCFHFMIEGDTYEGSFIGVVALKVSRNNGIEKFACGGFTQLKKNGQTVLELKDPADILLTKIPGKGYKLQTDHTKK